MIKPDVVLYEEALDNDVMYRAVEYIRKADMMIVAGSSSGGLSGCGSDQLL